MQSNRIENSGVPYRIRTGVAAVRGRCPGPLDEGDGAAGVIAAGGGAIKRGARARGEPR